MIEKLPNDTRSKVVGNSPLLGQCTFSYRAIALHLEEGYTVKEIAEIFINPNNKKPVTAGRVHQLIEEMKNFMVVEGLC